MTKPEEEEKNAGAAEHAMKLIGTLENFVPSADFDDYLERAENFFELNCITDDEFKRKLIVHFIGLPALKKLQQLLYPKTHKQSTYKEVTDKLKSYFSPQKNRIAQSVEFFKRSQHEYEKVADFAVELQALSKHCVFEQFLDAALRDKFIAGLRNAKIQAELMNSPDNTRFDEAVTKAKNLEQIEEDQQKMKAKQQYANRVNGGNVNRRNRSQSRKPEQSERGQRSSSRGRPSSRGGPRGRKDFRCYACGKKGHMARSCWSNKANVVNRSDDDSVVDSDDEVNHVVNVPLFKRL
ncbi:paraneoplastic antigen Ma3 homolog [Culex quinquefasciatus]|uniref:paraneoplastic antigen Ma3 homolog n=1 Tax=Culex quinquefasciatus TaxID=7176 RepID=UPI0018E323F9|nr:paraneoplastic antigen Ma3 homolog [Culex quinquefasciatus]